MSVQEAALYGDLVLALRDHAAEQLAAQSPDRDVNTARARLDEFIRAWFFTPQKELYGSAPRDVIWREQLGEPNPLPKEYAADVFGDDCPICKAMREEIENAESDEAHGHHWGYAPDTCLLEQYDPEGAEARWRKEFARMESAKKEREQPSPSAPDYTPPSAKAPQLDPEAFLTALRQPWLDPALHKAAAALAERCDVPVRPVSGGTPYRRITHDEAAALVAGLSQQGVDVDALLAHLDAWPYENVALDWLSEPERSLYLVWQAQEQAVAPDDAAGRARYRHHREFIAALAGLIPLGARLWMSGWLAAVILRPPSPTEGRKSRET